MLPFIRYDVGDHHRHWLTLSTGADQARLPKILLVNWVRRTASGGFVWPGFGDNSRVLTWIIERLEGTADAVETPTGFMPTGDALDLTGLDTTPAEIKTAVHIDAVQWHLQASADSSGTPLLSVPG